MTVILGLSIGHPDSSACLLLNGNLVGAVSEERLGLRIKHDSTFPHNAIKWLLESNNIALKDINYVAVARNPMANLAAKASIMLQSPMQLFSRISGFVQRNKKVWNLTELIAASLSTQTDYAKFKIVLVEHHLAHIASSYYTSHLDHAKALSFDGSGDHVSLMTAECAGTNIKVLQRKFLPESLGIFYSAMCQFIGFDKFGEEYKVMGLAPYGDNAYLEELRQIIALDKSLFTINKKYIDSEKAYRLLNIDEHHKKVPPLFTDQMNVLLGPARLSTEPISQREKDIARSTQIHFENISQSIIQNLIQPGDNLVQAGGCSLNGVNNAKILENNDVNDFYIHPAAADDGTAVGAAFFCWHNKLKRKERFHLTHAFLGPSYSQSYVNKCLESEITESDCFEVKIIEDRGELVETAAKDISEDKVVGWYQGASEWGPRALGQRSILANPTNPNMKDIINKKIKKRESFRPFAPSVLSEEVKIYFEKDVYSPFMMHVVKFKKEWRGKFPSVTHVDYTGRIQSVSKEHNLLYYNLILAVKKLTGHGIVLNTSFNENEPVVDTPNHALSCFKRTDMDVLYLGNTRIEKYEQK